MEPVRCQCAISWNSKHCRADGLQFHYQCNLAVAKHMVSTEKCLLLQCLEAKNYWGKNQRDLSSLSHVCCVSCVRRCPRKPRNKNIFLFTVFTHLLLETSRQNKAKLQNTIDQSPSKKVLEMPRNDWTFFQIFGKTDTTSTDVTMCWPKRLKFQTFVPTKNVPNQS